MFRDSPMLITGSVVILMLFCSCDKRNVDPKTVIIENDHHYLCVEATDEDILFFIEFFDSSIYSLSIDTVSFINLYIDVNQNNEVDGYQDVCYHVSRGDDFCTAFLVDSARTTFCDQFYSRAKAFYTFNNSTVLEEAHPIYSIRIPKNEIEFMRAVEFNVSFGNSKKSSITSYPQPLGHMFSFSPHMKFRYQY